MRVALVCDHLKEYGGAERFLEAMLELWPGAPIYTSVVAYEALPRRFQNFNIEPSFLQPLSFLPFPLLVPLLPAAFGQFNFDGFDVVLSSHALAATSIVVRPGTRHVCYCHTPPRFLWGYPTDRAWQDRTWFRVVTGFLRAWLVMYDYLSAQRVDQFVTNSENVGRRIRKFYRREAIVVHCGYDITKSQKSKVKSQKFNLKFKIKKPFYFTVSRLVHYKNVHIAIEACNRLKKNLVIVGEGPEEGRLRKMAGRTVVFGGRVGDAELRLLYQQCAAVIFPGEDDFGNVPVEAMLAGKPVLALGRGGALETVVAGKTGAFFDAPTAASLTEVLERFDPNQYDAAACRRRAMRFSKRQFLKRMSEIVDPKKRIR